MESDRRGSMGFRRRARRDTILAAGLAAGLVAVGASRVVVPEYCYALAGLVGLAAFSFGCQWVHAAAVGGQPGERWVEVIRRAIAYEEADMTAATDGAGPAAGGRHLLVREDGTADVYEWWINTFGERYRHLIGRDLLLPDAELLAHGGPRLAALEAALRAIQQWDCLNPPDPNLCHDHPWLKRTVDDALAGKPYDLLTPRATLAGGRAGEG